MPKISSRKRQSQVWKQSEMTGHHYGLCVQHPEGSAAASKLCNQERAGLRKWHLEEEQNLCGHGRGSASPAFVCFDLILCPLTLSSLTMWPHLPHLPNTYLLHCIAKDKDHKPKIHLWDQIHCCEIGKGKIVISCYGLMSFVSV